MAKSSKVLIERNINSWKRSNLLRPITLKSIASDTDLPVTEVIKGLEKLGRDLVKVNKLRGYEISRDKAYEGVRIEEVGVPASKFLSKKKSKMAERVPKKAFDGVFDKWMENPKVELSLTYVVDLLKKKYPQVTNRTVSNYLSRRGTTTKKLNAQYFHGSEKIQEKVVRAPKEETKQVALELGKSSVYTSTIDVEGTEMSIKGDLNKVITFTTLLVNSTELDVNKEVLIKLKRLS